MVVTRAKETPCTARPATVRADSTETTFAHGLKTWSESKTEPTSASLSEAVGIRRRTKRVGTALVSDGRTVRPVARRSAQPKRCKSYEEMNSSRRPFAPPEATAIQGERKSAKNPALTIRPTNTPTKLRTKHNSTKWVAKPTLTTRSSARFLLLSFSADCCSDVGAKCRHARLCAVHPQSPLEVDRSRG